ncbi:hypothetical protein AB1Y20_019260 [Prymnesium parvum]|uniref:Uncharacterized protein n=1 Tax=Prymnesium parvum TaxID=97485 RepID=A0AB34JTZ4_PRYPA
MLLDAKAWDDFRKLVYSTYRNMAVRQQLLRDEESVPYLLRKHYEVASKGFATVGEAAYGTQSDPCASIYERMAEGRDFAY